MEADIKAICKAEANAENILGRRLTETEYQMIILGVCYGYKEGRKQGANEGIDYYNAYLKGEVEKISREHRERSMKIFNEYLEKERRIWDSWK